MQNEQVKPTDKKEYATPTLTTHGGVDSLTQQTVPDGSGYTPPPPTM